MNCGIGNSLYYTYGMNTRQQCSEQPEQCFINVSAFNVSVVLGAVGCQQLVRSHNNP